MKRIRTRGKRKWKRFQKRIKNKSISKSWQSWSPKKESSTKSYKKSRKKNRTTSIMICCSATLWLRRTGPLQGASRSRPSTRKKQFTNTKRKLSIQINSTLILHMLYMLYLFILEDPMVVTTLHIFLTVRIGIDSTMLQLLRYLALRSVNMELIRMPRLELMPTYCFIEIQKLSRIWRT